MRVWKLVGLGGLLGASPPGRPSRVTSAYAVTTPREIRERLHARHDEAVARGPRTPS